MSRVCFLILWSLLANCSFSQLQSSFSFTHYGMPNGLASNEVNQVAQDHMGYIWIATNNGLQRFDGVQYKTFRHREGDPTSLPENNIVGVLVDKLGRIFILTGKGYTGIFNNNSFTYKSSLVTPRHQSSMLTELRFISDESGHLFLLLRGHELLQYIEAKNEFSAVDNFIPLKPEWQITTMSQQPGTEKYWIGLLSGGIVIYNHKNGKLSYRGHIEETEPAINIIKDKLIGNSMFDSHGRFWFDHWETSFPYAVYFNTRKPTDSLKRYEFLSTLKTYNETGGFMQQKDGRLWVRGLKILGVFNETAQKFQLISKQYKTENGILYDEVCYLYEDREKNVWVCTRNNGLYRCNPSQQYFTNVLHIKAGALNPAEEGGLMSFLETKKGDLIAGSWGTGMFRYDQNFNLIPLGFKGLRKNENPYAWNMCFSADSNIVWIGAQPGLYKYNQITEVMRFRNPPILQSKTIQQVAEDKNGNLWLGMHRMGVYRWIDPKNSKKDSIFPVPGAGRATVNKILADGKGVVWVATDTAGLLLYDGASGNLLNHYTDRSQEDSGQMGHQIISVMEYSDSLVVIANPSQLFFYNRSLHKVIPLTQPEAFLGNITALQKDEDGYIWVSTTNALYRFHPIKKALVQFNRFDGIANDHFEVNSTYKMRDGRLIFGNTTAFIVFNPKQINLSEKFKPVVFTSIIAGKSELSVDSILKEGQLTLSAKENSVVIAFSSLTYANNQLIQYKMEGLDEEWRFADRDNHASFPFLPPGRYKLLLRTINGEGVPSQRPTILLIHIKPPFYQTWWFYTLIAFAFAAELWWLDRQRSLRKKSMQKVRTDISDGLHKEINEALNNINILSEIARLKSDKEPQKTKEYLEQIHTKSHSMIIAMDDMLWSLDPTNDSMDKTINRIKEFADAIMQHDGVIIKLLIDNRLRHLQLNMRLRHEAFLLFKEGLQNLVAAGTRQCIVNLVQEKTKLLFTIEFENEGCNMQQLNNLLQRRDIETRLKALGAKLNVQLYKSKSVFVLQFPL